MPGGFVIKSRHQTTFHFRRRVPLDLVEAIGKTHQVASLKTESRRQATVRARLLATHFDALFASIRMTKDPKKLEELIAKAKQKIEIDVVVK
jgi:23S rRNA maturation mini-RNase III